MIKVMLFIFPSTSPYEGLFLLLGRLYILMVQFTVPYNILGNKFYGVLRPITSIFPPTDLCEGLIFGSCSVVFIGTILGHVTGFRIVPPPPFFGEAKQPKMFYFGIFSFTAFTMQPE